MLTGTINLSLAIYKINPSAEYRLSSSIAPNEIVEWRGPGPQPTEDELYAAWDELQTQYFMGVLCFNSVDVDNVVSDAIKEQIAPGRPKNLQSEAEKSLLAKISSINAKVSLGLNLTQDEITYLSEKLQFYATVIQPIRDAGNVFIEQHNW
jgi:hypothetical protein